MQNKSSKFLIQVVLALTPLLYVAQVQAQNVNDNTNMVLSEQVAGVYGLSATTVESTPNAEKRYLGVKARDVIICTLLLGGYIFARRGINSRRSNW